MLHERSCGSEKGHMEVSMSIPSIHGSLRSQAVQQNAAATHSTNDTRYRPAVKVTISETGAAQLVGAAPSASDALETTLATGNLAQNPFEGEITLRRAVSAYQSWTG